ncbi:MAG TPA: hypothetical protein VIU34_21140 [Steroidobacter sp.]
MQRLFSMFPTGAPAIALLMLRLFAAATLLVDATMALHAREAIAGVIALLAAATLFIGFVTPIAALVTALVDLLGMRFGHETLSLHSFALTVIALALALLGPGAYSLDARLFGRRLMQIGPLPPNDDR